MCNNREKQIFKKFHTIKQAGGDQSQAQFILQLGGKSKGNRIFLPKSSFQPKFPFPFKGNQNQFLPFRFRSSRNRKSFTNFGCQPKFWPKLSFF